MGHRKHRSRSHDKHGAKERRASQGRNSQKRPQSRQDENGVMNIIHSTKDFFIENIQKVGLPGLGKSSSSKESSSGAGQTAGSMNANAMGGVATQASNNAQYELLSANSNTVGGDDPMTSEQSFYSARDHEEMDTSMLSYTHKALERSTIGENNLRLNVFASILLMLGNLFLS